MYIYTHTQIDQKSYYSLMNWGKLKIDSLLYLSPSLGNELSTSSECICHVVQKHRIHLPSLMKFQHLRGTQFFCFLTQEGKKYWSHYQRHHTRYAFLLIMLQILSSLLSLAFNYSSSTIFSFTRTILTKLFIYMGVYIFFTINRYRYNKFF